MRGFDFAELEQEILELNRQLLAALAISGEALGASWAPDLAEHPLSQAETSGPTRLHGGWLRALGHASRECSASQHLGATYSRLWIADTMLAIRQRADPGDLRVAPLRPAVERERVIREHEEQDALVDQIDELLAAFTDPACWSSSITEEEDDAICEIVARARRIAQHLAGGEGVAERARWIEAALV